MYLADEGLGDVSTVVGTVTNPIGTLATAITNPVNAVKALGAALGIGPKPADQAAWAHFTPQGQFTGTLTNSKSREPYIGAATQIGEAVNSWVASKNQAGTQFNTGQPFRTRIGGRDQPSLTTDSGQYIQQNIAPLGDVQGAINATEAYLQQHASQSPAVPSQATTTTPPPMKPPTPTANQAPAAVPNWLQSLLQPQQAPAAQPSSISITTAGGSAPGAAAPSAATMAGLPPWALPVMLGAGLLLIMESNQGRRR